MEDLKILTVFERLFLRKSKFMFKVDRSETPPYINDMFNQRIFDENMPLLRSAISSNFIPPRPKKEIFKQSLIYSGPIEWNSLPATLKKVNSVSSFHNHFIKWLKQKINLYIMCLFMVYMLFFCVCVCVNANILYKLFLCFCSFCIFFFFSSS